MLNDIKAKFSSKKKGRSDVDDDSTDGDKTDPSYVVQGATGMTNTNRGTRASSMMDRLKGKKKGDAESSTNKKKINPVVLIIATATLIFLIMTYEEEAPQTTVATDPQTEAPKAAPKNPPAATPPAEAPADPAAEGTPPEDTTAATDTPDDPTAEGGTPAEDPTAPTDTAVDPTAEGAPSTDPMADPTAEGGTPSEDPTAPADPVADSTAEKTPPDASAPTDAPADASVPEDTSTSTTEESSLADLLPNEATPEPTPEPTPTDVPPASVDSVDGSMETDDATTTDKILNDLEKQVKKEQPKAVVKKYVNAPDYEYRGRGLVYNCAGKHWACVDAPSYKTCEDNYSSVTYLRKKVECFPFNVYQDSRGCAAMQNRVVSSNAKTNFCQGN